MVQPMSLQYYSSGLQEQDPYVITALFTRAGTRAAGFTGTQGSQPGGGIRLLQTTGVGVGVSQAEIDSFLGTTDEFLATALDGVSVGTAEAGAILIRTDGQVDKLLGCRLSLGDLTNVGGITETYAPITTTLTAGTTETAAKVGSEGNICIKFLLGAGDGYNPCQIQCDILYKAK